MKKNKSGNITLRQLEKEVESLRKKIFVYETLMAEKDIEKGRVNGPFKNGEEVIKHIKK
jgi:hypothetical protein